MGQTTPLSAGSQVLVDANVFIALGDPSNSKFARFQQAVREADVVLKIPRRVIGEVGGRDTVSVQAALDAGWARIIDPPSPTDGDAIQASDIARRTIANTTGQSEHDVEKADTILAGLAIQQLKDNPTSKVIVLTDDRAARRGVETAVTAGGYEDEIEVLGIADIIGDQSADSIRLI